MTKHAGTVERLRGLAWPTMLASGLLLVLLAQVQWGSTDEGVEPSITGLGRVTILGASDDDVAFFFEDNTGRPGLSVVVLGAVIAVVAGVVMFLMGMASRARRTTGGPRKGRRRTDDDDTVIEAHKVDGTWVAYGWERSGR